LLWLLWPLEIAAIALTLLFAVFPDLDYALREYRAYLAQPSQQTLQAFERKRSEEPLFRTAIAGSFGLLAGLIAVPISRIRKRNRQL